MAHTAWSELPRIGEENWFPTTPARLIDQARRRPDAPAYLVHDGSGWQASTWRDYADQARQAARALVALGVGKDDAVCILGFNRPEWTVMANAAMMTGARPAGIYWTSAPPESAYILQHSEAPVLLVETLEQVEELEAVRRDCPDLRQIVVMEGNPGRDDILSWTDFLALGDGNHQDTVDARLAGIGPEDIGALIYTSGTTGPPKAVMLSHGAIAWTADLLTRSFGGDETGRGLSYLPLAHIAEQQASLHCHPIRGNAMYFARSMETLAEDINTVRPTMFFGVPRVWEKMAETLRSRMAEASGTRKALLDWSMQVNRAWHAANMNGAAPGALLSLQRKLANRLVTRKIKGAIGLDRADTFISGAAPISPEVLRFFTGLDMPILEGYGQSETSAPTTANLPGAVRLGSVGKPFPGIETKVSEEGELLVRGPGLFSGYMKNNEATAEAFTADGWLRTGDVVKVDEDGFITITGRIKDILITSGGKNITPANLETDLMNIPLVEHAVVVGDARHYLTALMTLSADALAAFAKKKGIADPGPDHPEVVAEVQAGVDAMNKRYARVENIRKFRLLSAPLSVETGELTPTMKVKRKVVIERNRALVDAMYDGD
ncbi:long-chain fatty acid--CoA ligase [Marinicauda algicola]|uniref:Long-chain fatty acid--CoA ligase n=1 Tax=Marinicauda algicola TaxID=2029849 RepID=A0A4S2H532_9PROT|nr:long-chain fatty acid--CoA ligase [Marinicauda algicola]TGY90422.1 long-chain fatty acid--CoA ligase [Marinicauda algicola]